MKNEPGIYKIKCLKNDKVYIGSSQVVRQRITNHKSDLRLDKHQNKHLQAAWKKYGEESFEFEIVEYCSLEVLLKREQYYIDLYDTYKLGFNRMPLAASPRGRKYTEEEKVRRALSRKTSWNKGLARTDEQKKAQSDKMKGRVGWSRGIVKSEKRKIEQRATAVNKKIVLILNKQTLQIIKEYESLSDLARELSVKRETISSMCLYYKKRKVFANSPKNKIDFYIVFKQDF